MEFSCLATGSFHQGDARFSYESRNAQCMANAAFSIAWKVLGGEWNTSAIDQILLAGNQLYLNSRQENSVSDRYLFPEDLSKKFQVMGQTVNLDVQFVCNGLYPKTNCDFDDSVNFLSEILQTILCEDSVSGGFLFTGQLTTVAFWRRQGRLYVFDSHAVNEKRQHDTTNNFARIFVCESYSALASLLMCNAAMDGNVREFNITEIKYSIVNESDWPIAIDVPNQSVEHNSILNVLKPTVSSSPVKEMPVSSSVGKKGRGRPKKVKRGRPKTLSTTREEQVKEAKKRYTRSHPENNRLDVQRYTETHPEVNRAAVERYSQQHPEVNRAAVERYSQQHPEVNRAAVERYSQQHPEVNRAAVERYSQQHPEVHRAAVERYSQQHPEVNRAAVGRYSQQHPEVNREAVRQYSQRHPEASLQRVQIFRLKNPKLSELRHLPSSLARDIVVSGPLASWRGDFLDKINPFKLKHVSLWDNNIYRCPHCDARLFEEERNRKKWCCGEGAFNILNLPSLQEPFYSDRRFLERARAYNDLFAF